MKMIVIGNKAIYSVLVHDIEYYEQEDTTRVTIKSDAGLTKINLKGNQLQRLADLVNEANKISFSGTYLNNSMD